MKPILCVEKPNSISGVPVARCPTFDYLLSIFQESVPNCAIFQKKVPNVRNFSSENSKIFNGKTFVSIEN